MNNINKIIILLILILIIISYLEKIDFFSNLHKKQYIYIINDSIIEIDINEDIYQKLDSLKKPIVYIQGSVHGNEPSGTDTCNKILDQIKKKEFSKFNGTLIIFPYPNLIGYTLGIRWALKDINLDINRNFVNKGKCKISKKIIQIVKKSDFIVDLHEGWGYRLKNKSSIGSTVSPTKNHSIEISKKIILELNKTISEDYKKFTINEKDDCDIKSTLRCFCSKNDKNYILVETTGQNNIQPIEIRVNQMYLIIKNLLQLINK